MFYHWITEIIEWKSNTNQVTWDIGTIALNYCLKRVNKHAQYKMMD